MNTEKILGTPQVILKMILPEGSPQELIDKIGRDSGGNIGGTVRDGSDSEKFNVGSLVFNVNRAKELSAGKSNDEIEVSSHWSDKIFVDDKAAMGSTSNNPVLVAQVPTSRGVIPLLIDGHHRMYKAVKEGKKALPAFVLSPDQSVDLIETHPDIINCLRSYLHEDANPIMKAFKTLSSKFDQVMKSLGPTRSDVHTNSPLGSDDDHFIKSALEKGEDDKKIVYPLNNTEVGAGDFPEPDDESDEIVKSAFEVDDDTGIHTIQEMVSGMDHELESDKNTDNAKGKAQANLSEDPHHYKKIRMEKLGEKFSDKDNKLKDGLHLHLGSAGTRKPHHIGYDVQPDPEDHGSQVHDLNLPVPVADNSARSVYVDKSMKDLSEDPKALMAEVVRLLMPGGQFVYEGPNELYNYPEDLVPDGRSEVIDKEANTVRHSFIKPDPATANDAEPRVGIERYDNQTADQLLAQNSIEYELSDQTTTGKDNRALGYASQGGTAGKSSPEPKTKSGEKIRKILKSAAVVPIFKADKMKQILYCVVYEPNEVDMQEDWMPAEEIEAAAHSYLVNSRVVAKNHTSGIRAEVIESFIAPQDLEYKGGQYGDQVVRKGSWVIGIKVNDQAEWQKVVDGDYTGVSVGGFGVRD